MQLMSTRLLKAGAVAGAVVASAFAGGPAAAWEPTKPVTFVIPAGTGGGADQMRALSRASSPSTI